MQYIFREKKRIKEDQVMQFKHWFSKTILLSIQWFRIVILKNEVDKSTIGKVTWITLSKDKHTVSLSPFTHLR